jgi:hypothetical protein
VVLIAARFGIPQRDDLETFLLSDGANVRNLAAHGFIHTVDPLNAAAAPT